MPADCQQPPVCSEPRCRVRIGRSRTLFAVIAGGHLLAGASVLLAPLPAALLPLLAGAIGVSALGQLRCHAVRRGPAAVVELTVDGCGMAQLVHADGHGRRAKVLGSTFVSPWLTIVRLRVDGQRRLANVLLVADNCHADAFRRLRVSLGWQVGPLLRYPQAVD